MTNYTTALLLTIAGCVHQQVPSEHQADYEHRRAQHQVADQVLVAELVERSRRGRTNPHTTQPGDSSGGASENPRGQMVDDWDAQRAVVRRQAETNGVPREWIERWAAFLDRATGGYLRGAYVRLPEIGDPAEYAWCQIATREADRHLADGAYEPADTPGERAAVYAACRAEGHDHRTCDNRASGRIVAGSGADVRCRGYALELTPRRRGGVIR